MKLKLPLFAFSIISPAIIATSCTKKQTESNIVWSNIDIKVDVKDKQNIYLEDLKEQDITHELNNDDVQVGKILIISRDNSKNLANISIELVSKTNPNIKHTKVLQISGFKVKETNPKTSTTHPTPPSTGAGKGDSSIGTVKPTTHGKTPQEGTSPTNDINRNQGSSGKLDQGKNNTPQNPNEPEKTNPNNSSNNSSQPVEPNNSNDTAQPIKKENPPVLISSEDSHFLSVEDLQKNSPNQVYKMTKSYNDAILGLNNFLKSGNHGNPVDFTNAFDKNVSDKFWDYTNKIGVYGNYGENEHQKVEFYNRSLSINGMVKQVYLPKFTDDDKLSAKNIDKSQIINGLIAKNTFGFLPSNLSQFLYYASLESISKHLQIDNIKNIRANFDDEKGTIDLLIENSTGEKFLININKVNANNLKNNDDFYNYIYDRSFMFSWYAMGWERDFFEKDKGIQYKNESGTMWVVDRVINPEAEKEGYYEFLVATNIHVFSLRRIFDKSLYFSLDSNKPNASQWNGGFYPLPNNLSERTNRYFYGTRGNQTRSLKGNNFVNSENGQYYPIAKAYEQYLIAPYYTPRYYADGFWDIDAETGKKHLEVYDQTSRIGGTKNAGADFVILRLKIHKSALKNILPKLQYILDYEPEKEKDWYIGLGKNELFHPIKTQFYGGYPINVDENFNQNYTGPSSFSFKYNKSTGGVINTQNRVVNKDVFQSLWVKYDENENKDWNSHLDNYKKYTSPFIQGEHGMAKTILTQHSQLYTYAPYEQRHNILGPGSSGSMVIDSSFNLIGINYLFTRDATYTDTFSNAVALMEGHGDYKNGFDGNIRTDFVKKLVSDNVKTVKLNP
ncbi:Hypothetical protein, predicted lipoprotein [Mycoplasmopsis bovigenitalium 51080]|uniref:DUF31 domain-containing protein n=1 Tax=Mycoplasmopsis bovigenitalium 51080 TaxID=1188235 RepID=N9TSA2_9BACT|nr:hypothetical protein [Mycoplasmopsis bovigenitalium]ENY69034.1 Hypothetical protein, predicted lipoprotein [Mycoplasmopsis bovigenitalium 51080]